MPTQTQQIPIGGKLTSAQPQQLSIRELSALYDRIYDIADRLFKKYNPCKIHMKNKRIFCECHQKGIPLANKCYLCCSNCKYCSKNGCIIKCLACKLHRCYGQEFPMLFMKRLNKLHKIARSYKFSLDDYYLTKKEVLKRTIKRIEDDNYGG